MAVTEERDLLTGLRRGTLEFCVLATMRGGPRYALEVTRALGPVLLASEGTLYPLLSRLRRDGLVDTDWQESPSGPPRRYYRLTARGAAAVSEFTGEWARFRAAVDTVLEGTDEDQHRDQAQPEVHRDR